MPRTLGRQDGGERNGLGPEGGLGDRAALPLFKREDAGQDRDPEQSRKTRTDLRGLAVQGFAPAEDQIEPDPFERGFEDGRRRQRVGTRESRIGEQDHPPDAQSRQGKQYVRPTLRSHGQDRDLSPA